MNQPPTQRDLIARAPTTTPVSMSGIQSITCPKCGVFKRSGVASCCAPGGAWFENCGGAGNSKMHHKWVEGVKACQRKFKVEGMWIYFCVATCMS